MRLKKKLPSQHLSCDFGQRINANGYCNKGLSHLFCRNNYHCYSCEYLDILYQEDLFDPIPFSPADITSVLDVRTNYVYYRKAVLVSFTALERLGRPQLLYYQMFYCEDGPGCLPGNPVGAIYGYFLSAKSKRQGLTFSG